MTQVQCFISSFKYLEVHVLFLPVRDAVLDGDAYTGGWEDSDYDVDGDVADAAVGDEALGLPSIPESQDDQLLK